MRLVYFLFTNLKHCGMDPIYEQPPGLPDRYNFSLYQRKPERTTCLQKHHAQILLAVQCCLVLLVCSVLGVLINYSVNSEQKSVINTGVLDDTDSSTLQRKGEFCSNHKL